MRARAALAALCVSLWAPAALAGGIGPGDSGERLVDGTARYATAADAAETNAKIFGAIGSFERHLLPAFQKDKGKGDIGYIFAAEIGLTKGVTHAIGTCPESDILLKRCPGGRAMHSVSVGYGNLSLHYPLGKYLGFFYSSAFVAAYTGVGGLDVRDTYGTIMYPVMGYAFGPVSFFGKNAYDKVTGGLLEGTGADAVAGFSLRSPLANGFVGYAASQGVFTDLMISDLDTFITTLFGDSFSDLSFIKGGLREFDYFKNSDLAKKIGRLNVFGERLVYNVPATGGLARSGLTAPLTSFHVEQLAIGERVDLRVAYRIQPRAEVAEARLGWRMQFDGASKGDGAVVVATGGVVKLPDLWMFGAQGGYRPAFSLRMSTLDSLMGVSLLINDPEVLNVYPYAYNSVTLNATLGFSSKRD